jgi:hypothetical protein
MAKKTLPKKEETVRFNMILPLSEHAAIQAAATKESLSMTMWVRLLLKKALSK